MTARAYIMIGAPVSNLRTPRLLEQYFADLGMTARVEVRHLEPGDLDRFMQEIAGDSALDGLLVTMPHKRAVMPYLQAVSSVARHLGSVNAVKRTSTGTLVGAQFDGAALVNALLAKQMPLATANILLLGIGAAGLAIAQAIADHGCRHLAIADRDPALVEAAMTILANPLVTPAASGDQPYDLLINATPLGMAAGDPSPFHTDLIAGAACVADIVADPARTRLAEQTRQAGVHLVTGRDMVIGQIEAIGHWLRTPATDQGRPHGG
ncbi:MAG: shikimate dehydrogenase family protein [Alphaproteobacteria bacterium]